MCLLGLGLVLGSSVSAAAQEAPNLEFSAGYAYLHEEDLSVPAGWYASVGKSLTDMVSIVGAVSGHYKTQTEFGVDVKTRLHTYVVGPKFASYRNPTFTPWGQILLGGARASGDVALPGTGISVSASSSGFDVQPGAGIDVRATPNLLLRVGVNADIIRSEGETARELQIIAGIVIRK
jgi:hypothetical protein